MDYLKELDKRMKDADTPGTTPGNCGLKLFSVNVNGKPKIVIYIPEIQAVYFSRKIKNKKTTYDFITDVKTFSEAEAQAKDYYSKNE